MGKLAKVLALVILGLLIIVSVLLGRKIKPYELEQEVIPGVKPYIPSEEVAIFGTHLTKVEEILRQDNPEFIPLDDIANPEAEQALANGDNLWAQGQLEAARDCYLEASRLLSNDITVLLRLAGVQENLGEIAAALQTYRQVLDINPEIAEASAALARLEKGSRQN